MADNKLKKSSRPIRKQQKQTSNSSSWLNFFRIGESYSSLVLGIIVVIITTILLVLLVRDRNITSDSDTQKNISSTNTEIAKTNSSPTISVRIDEVTPTLKPTTWSTVTPSKQPTVIPSKTLRITTVQPTNPLPTKTAVSEKLLNTHTVVNGENLWSIAEKYYRSGYNWVDISRVNNLSNPGVIKVGMKLSIPDVKAKIATVSVEKTEQSIYGPKITGTTYKIVKGDHLWGVAVRAFNDGYKWLEIARVNNITTPNVIQPGLILKLPRTAPQNPK